MTKRDVLRAVKERAVRFVRLSFVDILGINKSVTVPVAEIERALEGRVAFDGGSIDGFVRGEEADMMLVPDLGTFAVLPWTTGGAVEARLICDIATPDGEPFEGCPRTALRRALEEAGPSRPPCAPASKSSFICSRSARRVADDRNGRHRLVLRRDRKRSRRRRAHRDRGDARSDGHIRRERAPRTRRRANTRSTSTTRRSMATADALSGPHRSQARRRPARLTRHVHAQAAGNARGERRSRLSRARRRARRGHLETTPRGELTEETLFAIGGLLRTRPRSRRSAIRRSTRTNASSPRGTRPSTPRGRDAARTRSSGFPSPVRRNASRCAAPIHRAIPTWPWPVLVASAADGVRAHALPGRRSRRLDLRTQRARARKPAHPHATQVAAPSARSNSTATPSFAGRSATTSTAPSATPSRPSTSGIVAQSTLGTRRLPENVLVPYQSAQRDRRHTDVNPRGAVGRRRRATIHRYDPGSPPRAVRHFGARTDRGADRCLPRNRYRSGALSYGLADAAGPPGRGAFAADPAAIVATLVTAAILRNQYSAHGLPTVRVPGRGVSVAGV